MTVMTVRPVRREDETAIEGVVTRAFENDGPTVASLVTALRASGHLRAECVGLRDPYLAELEERFGVESG
jgi:hypothetical protein